MLICPYCKSLDNYVTSHYFRYNQKHDDFKRYRRCRACGNSFITVERYDPNSSSHSGNRGKHDKEGRD